MSINEKMTAIAEPIRALSKETSPLTLDDMAANLSECVDANANLESVLYGTDFGGKSYYDKFWDNYQSNGAVKSYTRYFQGAGWSDLTFNPKYPIVATAMQATFHSNSNITKIPVLVDVSTSSNMSQAFYGCSALTQLQLKVSEDTPFASNTFQACYALTDLSIDGTIGNALDIHWSTKLSAVSLLSILAACNKEGALVTITLPANCIDGKTNTETYIANDTELNTALTNARWNGYTVVFN